MPVKLRERTQVCSITLMKFHTFIIQTPGVELLDSRLKPARMTLWEIQHPISNIQHPVSGIRYLTSSIRQ